MKTSAGAPCSIWRASAEDAAYENRTCFPVLAVKAAPTSSSAFLSEAAARTVIGAGCARAAIGAASNSATSAIETPRRTQFISSLHREDHVRGFDQRSRRLAGLQIQRLGALMRNGRGKCLAAAEIERDLIVDGAAFDMGDQASQRVASRGLQRAFVAGQNDETRFDQCNGGAARR